MWQITLEPGHGAVGNSYDNGVHGGPFYEAELAQILAFHIHDELDKNRFRNKLLKYSRPAPSVRDRIRDIENTCLLVSLHFEQYKGARNKSVVYYNDNTQAKELADWLLEPLYKWGNACTPDYWKSEMQQGDFPHFKRDAPSIVISPFSVVGEDAVLYVQRLIPLAKILSHALATWVLARNPGARLQEPFSTLKPPEKPRDAMGSYTLQPLYVRERG